MFLQEDHFVSSLVAQSTETPTGEVTCTSHLTYRWNALLNAQYSYYNATRIFFVHRSIVLVLPPFFFSLPSLVGEFEYWEHGPFQCFESVVWNAARGTSNSRKRKVAVLDCYVCHSVHSPITSRGGFQWNTSNRHDWITFWYERIWEGLGLHLQELKECSGVIAACLIILSAVILYCYLWKIV